MVVAELQDDDLRVDWWAFFYCDTDKPRLTVCLN